MSELPSAREGRRGHSARWKPARRGPRLRNPGRTDVLATRFRSRGQAETPSTPKSDDAQVHLAFLERNPPPPPVRQAVTASAFGGNDCHSSRTQPPDRTIARVAAEIRTRTSFPWEENMLNVRSMWIGLSVVACFAGGWSSPYKSDATVAPCAEPVVVQCEGAVQHPLEVRLTALDPIRRGEI